MEILMALIVILFLVYAIRQWWAKIEGGFIRALTVLKGYLAKKLGFVVVDHIVEWNGNSFREMQIFPRLVTETEIHYNNVAFARQQIKLHNLHMEPDIIWYWEYL
jgi:hypothetical protein